MNLVTEAQNFGEAIFKSVCLGKPGHSGEQRSEKRVVEGEEVATERRLSRCRHARTYHVPEPFRFIFLLSTW